MPKAEPIKLTAQITPEADPVFFKGTESRAELLLGDTNNPVALPSKNIAILSLITISSKLVALLGASLMLSRPISAIPPQIKPEVVNHLAPYLSLNLPAMGPTIARPNA